MHSDVIMTTPHTLENQKDYISQKI